MSKRMAFLVLGVTSTLAACSTTIGPSPTVTPVEDASTSLDAAFADADGGNVTPKVCPTSVHKTIVVVGDSISDVGSGETRAQQEPFYRTLLVKNDDERHADWKGYDLSTCWKLDATKAVVKASVGGAVATEKPDGERSILIQQAKSLPTSLEGPVLVVGTIGGNDLLSGLTNVVFGNTEKAKADLDAYVSGFGAAMAELTKPDRFGAGVKVDVLITNIFDPSDGTGRFRFTPEDRKCAGAFQLWPEGQPTEPTLVEWNSAMTAEAAKYRGVALLDLKALYKGHDVNQAAETNWFYKDCIHPNSAGHHGIRTLFWKGIVGLK